MTIGVGKNKTTKADSLSVFNHTIPSYFKRGRYSTGPWASCRMPGVITTLPSLFAIVSSFQSYGRMPVPQTAAEA
jgi:hypothetical protein